MGVRKLALLLVFVAVSTAAGAARLSGRFESRLSYARYRAGTLFFGDNAVRLGLEARPGARFALEAALRARAGYGARELDLGLMLPGPTVESLPDSLRALLRAPPAGGFELERAFATIDWSGLRVRVGKQPLAWGAAFLWNPTEVIPAKSWLEPTYEREGESALRLEWLAPVSPQAIWLPGADLAGSAAIGRVTGNVFGFDWALTGWRRPEAAGPTDYFIGGQLKGEIFAPGVWCEGGFHPAAGDRPGWWEIVAGVDHTLPTRTWVLVEYRHSSAGLAWERGYPARAWLEYVLAAQTELGRDRFYVLLRQPVAGFSSLLLGGLVNPGDRSAVILPGFQLDLADNADLGMFGIWSLGGTETEFGAGRARGAVARLTLHF